MLVLGATGTAGRLGVQIAKLLGAGRVVAAGRNEAALRATSNLGADATVRLDSSGSSGGASEAAAEAFVAPAGESGYDVILDYLWGAPTEALPAAMGRSKFHLASGGPRLVQIGEAAGPDIRVSADVLRSTGLSGNDDLGRVRCGLMRPELECVLRSAPATSGVLGSNPRRARVLSRGPA